MNYLRTFLLLFFVSFPLYITGQNIYFVADTTTGCDSLRVKFYFFNTTLPDTVTTVSWDFGNGEISSGKSDQETVYYLPGSYSVSIVINNNSTFSRSDYIRIYPSPDPIFTYSDSLELGSYTIVFDSPEQAVDTISYSWLWEFGDEETASTHSVIHTFPSSGTYMTTLIITNEAGCSSVSSREIKVNDILKWNNVFTPNYDNRNDNFVVLSNGVTVYSIKIYSRSGIQVYRAESPTIIWDGRNQSGQELPPGVYFFTIKSLDNSGFPEQSGFVLLFREKEKL
jgi:gliding motility-associated-like protein